MTTVLRKAHSLFNVKIRKIVDDLLETHLLKVIDDYICEVEGNLEALENSAVVVGGTVRVLKRKYEEFSKQAEKEKSDVDTLILRFQYDFGAAGPGYLNTKAELAQEYYEQWQRQKEQLEGLHELHNYLKHRLDVVRQIHTITKLSFDNDDPLDKDKLYTLADNEDKRIVELNAKQEELQKRMSIGQVELRLEERKRRLLGKNSDD